MEIITNFGNRSYIFYNRGDITKATSIYVKNTGTLDDFENDLDSAGIDWCYNL